MFRSLHSSVLAVVLLSSLVPAHSHGAVDGSCGSANGSVFAAPPSEGLCSSGAVFGFAGYGPWSWRCAGADGGNDAACSAAVQSWPLAVLIKGAGTGTVASSIPHAQINCGSACSQPYALNAVVTLTATPSSSSLFSSWSGCDSANGNLCTVTMSGAKSVSATFDQMPTEVKVSSTFYDSINNAFSALAGEDLLQLRSADFPSPPAFNRPITFTLGGGYDSSFAVDSGLSKLHGPITVSSGTVKLNKVLIGAPLPAPGNSGSIATVGSTGSAVSLAVAAAASTTPGTILQYQAYYSSTHALNSVSDIIAYGTPAGTPSPAVNGWVTGKVSNALIFSGKDYVDAGNGASLNFGGGSFTVESWVNPSAFVDCAGIVGKGASTPSEPGYALRQASNGSGKFFQFILGNGVQQTAVAMNGYTENNWYHVVGVADRSNNVLKLYVNGVLVGSTNIAGFGGSTDSATSLSLGQQFQRSIGQGRFFNGIIDEVALYNRALTEQEIVDRFNKGAGRSVEASASLAAGWRLDEATGAATADLSGSGNGGTLNFSSSSRAFIVGGLAPSTTYSVNILATDQYGNQVAYTPVTVSTPNSVLPIVFDGTLIPKTGPLFHPVVSQLNNNGFIAPLATVNDGLGNLTPLSAAQMGLGRLFEPGRIQRTCAVADFNGDTLPDIVCNVFSMHTPYTGSDPVCQAMSASTPYAPNSVAMLFFNNGDGTFTESPDFTNLMLRGVHGETIIAADFENKGCLDLFWPQASGCAPDEQNYFLINDCHGNFTEAADQVGVAMRNTPIPLRGEGAQAVDLNGDGWIDLYVGSHMFINNGVKNGKLTFSDAREQYGLPLAFDEGIKFTDWNNDGWLDLIIHHPTTGPALYQFDGTKFSASNAVAPFLFSESYGLNIFDMNNDGREDMIVSGGTNVAGVPDPTVVWLNNGLSFERVTTSMDFWGQDTISFGDFSGTGKLDIVKREADSHGLGLAYYKNQTPVPQNSFLKIELVGPNGEHNQQGRVVKIYPANHPGVIFTRFVDSGSGYLVQSPYEIFVGTPYQEPHRVEAYFYGKLVTFTMNPGEKRRAFADGTVVSY